MSFLKSFWYKTSNAISERGLCYICWWLGPIFLCSCAKFGEFDSSSESPKRCNSVFKESSQWPPAVLKLIPTSTEEKRNTILCHSIGKTNRKPLIFLLKKKSYGYCYNGYQFNCYIST